MRSEQRNALRTDGQRPLAGIESGGRLARPGGRSAIG